MKEKLAKLIDVKTIVTFAIIGNIIFLSIKGSIDSKDIVLFGGMILTYFFNRPKKEGE